MVDDFSVKPLNAEAWQDFETLFGPRGACGGCWCMLWRLPRRQFEAQKGEGNRSAMHALVDAGVVPGLLAYANHKPIGWCAVAPRKDYPALARSRILKPVDASPCWSIACLFIHKDHRRQGVSVKLLMAAAEFACTCGAAILEGYPIDPPPGRKLPPAFAWTGLAAAFRAAGFTEVARRAPTRPIMRRNLHPATVLPHNKNNEGTHETLP